MADFQYPIRTTELQERVAQKVAWLERQVDNKLALCMWADRNYCAPLGVAYATVADQYLDELRRVRPFLAILGQDDPERMWHLEPEMVALFGLDRDYSTLPASVEPPGPRTPLSSRIRSWWQHLARCGKR